MNQSGQILEKFNISCIITTKEGKVLSANTEDNDFINACIKNAQDNNETFFYQNNFYKVVKTENDRMLSYWAQNISKLKENFGKDDLTKLYDRGTAFPMIDQYILYAFENDEPFSIIMCDIDHFKMVNDKYGHDKGDKVLSDTARLLLNNFRTRDKYVEDRLNFEMRAKDILCRFGGEEIVIIVKNINEENTIKKAETIRELIEQRGLITMSFGVAHIDPKLYELNINKDNVSIERDKMIKIADICLYESKNNGRNQVRYYDAKTDQVRLAKEYTK